MAIDQPKHMGRAHLSTPNYRRESHSGADVSWTVLCAADNRLSLADVHAVNGLVVLSVAKLSPAASPPDTNERATFSISQRPAQAENTRRIAGDAECCCSRDLGSQKRIQASSASMHSTVCKLPQTNLPDSPPSNANIQSTTHTDSKGHDQTNAYTKT